MMFEVKLMTSFWQKEVSVPMMLHLFLSELIVKHVSFTAWKDDFDLTQIFLFSVQEGVKTDLSALIFKVAILW